MVIDGGAEVVSDVSPGTFTSLNIGMEMLFVGGTPHAFPPTNLIRFRTTGEEVRGRIMYDRCICTFHKQLM